MKPISARGTIAFMEAWSIVVTLIVILRFWIQRCKLKMPTSAASIAADIQVLLAWAIGTAAQGVTLLELIEIIHYNDAKIQDPMKHPLLQSKFHKVSLNLYTVYIPCLVLLAEIHSIYQYHKMGCLLVMRSVIREKKKKKKTGVYLYIC